MYLFCLKIGTNASYELKTSVAVSNVSRVISSHLTIEVPSGAVGDGADGDEQQYQRHGQRHL